MRKRLISPLFLVASLALSPLTMASDVSRPNLTSEAVIKAVKAQSEKSRINASVIDRYLQECATCTFVDHKSGGLSKTGEALFTSLQASATEGLNPARYHTNSIETLLNNQGDLNHIDALLIDGVLTYIRDLVEGRPELKRLDKDWLLEGRKINPADGLVKVIAENGASDFTQFEPVYPQYQYLKKALAHYEAKEGVENETILSDGKPLRKGDQNDRVIELRQRLSELGYLDSTEIDNSSFNGALESAVKKFQEASLLEPDGIVGRQSINELNMRFTDRIGQIRINLERWRWMPESLGEHYLVVDIPRYQYYIVKDGEEVMRAKTVVGMNRRQTPVFSSDMSYIVFSPYWNVPYSMAVKDQLPKLRQDPYRLERSNIRIYDRAGNEVDPGMIDWDQYTARTFPFTLRQDPGAYNSMGRVKFMFPNKHAIYLHDTPQRYLFDKTARTFSSGCIRIENPTELAEYLLDDQGWGRNKIEQSFNRKSEATVRLSKEMKFPVYTLYMTTEADSEGNVSFRPDIYNKDAVMLKAL